ncbi:TonB-dependent receptor [Sphingobium boeckii]|uniref:Iron complex outermembrane receptor protein n=1 Tax=Sphingobium boeckii TaxID=1082345 RepID=A0A7W9ED17_9SPHN|nr:TonB-dependent receptor [Sphingobium boeckii]MBB5684662.1 iron complex outermembrane receptor protein [Sphingobium boeckii]
MRHYIHCLLASAAFIGAPAIAQDIAPVDAYESDSEIIVIGSGQTRQVQELKQEDIVILTPGTSPLKAIEKLPSVNFQSADAFGAYEWSQRLSIRGFNQNQIGFTLDGIPLGDHSYGNVNGLHISRAISSENIGTTRVSQGGGSLGTQATNNLGGTIEFLSSDPVGAFGVKLNGTAGSDNSYRGFARIDAGSEGGARGYLSYGYLTTDKWKGDGAQRQHAVNAKAIVPVGNFNLTGFFSFSDRREQDYQDLSLDMIRRLGLENDNIADDYALALRIADVAANRGDSGATPLNPAAGTVYPAPYGTVDDVYFDAAGLRQDYLGSIGIDGRIAEGVTVSVKVYHHDNHGQGLWFTPYVPSPTGVPISIRTTEYDMKRTGVFGGVTAEMGVNTLAVGAWYENNDFQQARRFYGLTSRTDPGRSALQFQKDPFATQWDFDYNTKTLQYHVEDKIALGRATLALGWKGFQVKNAADPLTAGSLASGKIESKDWFQPHAGMTFKIDEHGEVFASFTQLTRAFTSSATTGPFATTQAGFAAISGSLKPEESDTYELGLRMKSGAFSGTAGVYYVNFRNRLLAFTTGAGIVGNPAILQNVGAVRSYGFETAGEFRLGGGFSIFGSYSYNDSTYRDDVFNALGVVVAATSGKNVVDSPKHLAKAELAYDDGTIFGRLGINYMSKRYFNYLNDRSVPGRGIADASLGYRFLQGALTGLEVQLNATNLFDKAYVATIGSNGFGNSGDNQTLLAGAPQQVFLTVRKGF